MRRLTTLGLATVLLSGCATGRNIPLPDCHKVAPLLVAPEDFAVDDQPPGTAPRLLISARAVRAKDPPGTNGIWALPVSETGPDPTPVPLLVKDGQSQCAIAGPHGITVAKHADPDNKVRLFVIDDRSCPGQDSPCSCDRSAEEYSIERYRVESDHLIFEERYSSPLLTRPNDLDVSADGTEIYVSNSQGGKCDWLARHGNVVHIVRTDRGQATWRVADTDLRWANGVALDEGRNRLYVSETLERQIRVYDIKRMCTRNYDSLVRVGTIYLGSGPDNLLWQDEAKTRLYVAAHPCLPCVWADAAWHCPSPSEAYVIENLDAVATWHAVYGNDGTQISAASTALPVKGHLYLGEAIDSGLLSCEMPGQGAAQ